VSGALGVGVVGLSARGGWAAATHVPALALARGVELRAVTASSPEATAASASAYAVRGWDDVAQLAADPSVDLVVVAVKTPDHAAAVRMALRAGTPVYCEWPLARSTSEAEELAGLSAELDVPLLVGLQGRSSPDLGRVRDLLAAGYVGEPLMVTVDTDGLMGGRTLPTRSSYQLDPGNGATVLTIPVGHLLDDLRMVLGPLSDLAAITAVGHPEVEIRETGERVPNGSVTHVAVVGRAGPRALVALACHGGSSRPPGLTWRILGSEGEIRIEGDLGHPQMAELTVTGVPAGGDPELLVEPGDRPHAVRCLAAAYEGVVASLGGRPSEVATATEAVDLHRLLDGLLTSASPAVT
jgi:predicted dehydrogenase